MSNESVNQSPTNGESNFETRYLNNGVPVLLAIFPDSETVTVGITYNVGGRNEWKLSKEHDGISHFLEHQFFKGGPKSGMSPIGVNQALDDLGGLTNAFTTKDTTCYFAKCLSSEVFNAIDLWSKIMIMDDISQEEFDKESFVVRQEFRRNLDAPPRFLMRKIMQEAFRGTSLEMDVIGTEESLENVTLKQMEEYRNKHYGLENAALMILGNYDKEQVFARLNERFGNQAVNSTKPRYELTSLAPASNSEMKYFKESKETPLVFFGLGIKTPGARSEDQAAFELLMAKISLGKSSMVQKRLIRSGITAFAFAFSDIYEDVGIMIVLAGAPKPVYPKAHEATMKMLYDALNMEVTQEEIDKLCDKIEFQRRNTSEEPFAMLFNQSTDFWRVGKFESMEEGLAKLRQVNVDQFNKVRNMVLKNLSGIYGVMGDQSDFVPNFPEGTWNGNFTSL